ncbi:MAG: biotin--[acetyl-CoA-carboxylase] ligase [Oscillospiraceae bacterium]|nr:biotin--[acetyl-CoA-carboxylase] ligase [Oscillospiraceae bacterium]
MSLKDDVLAALLQNRGKNLSGQRLAESFGVSRAAVCKAVASLKEDGHKIASGPNRGYLLLPESDVLTPAALLPHLQGCIGPGQLTVLPVCSSTNLCAKELAMAGAPDKSVVLAERQTAGRGRRGHTFYSPPGGLYLSMVLRPRLSARQCTFLTLAAAVAVCRAAEEVCGVQPRIKWVNDVFFNGKKICGILTEACADLEGGSLEYAVVGIGINVWLRREELPEELRGVVGALYEDFPGGDVRCRLAAALIRQLCLLTQAPAETLEEYRARNFLPGRDVMVLNGARTGPAKALSITDEGHLLVEFPDHTTLALTAGEVSVKEQNGWTC